jgi:exosortase A
MTVSQPMALPRPAELARGWQTHLCTLAAVSAAILLIFAPDAGAMAAIWWESSTFNHCLIILPLIGWLVWQRWPELRHFSPRAWLPGLAIVALGGFGWLLGQAAGVALARHLGLVVMLQGAVVACLGPAVARGLLFPLCYALFLVPFGEEFVPLLQTLTARMSMALLGLAGVPAHLDGVFISIPNGYFEVAEACSGAKFLIAMMAYGAVAANVCFRSWPRRIAFMAVSMVVPVLANGVRAWATIYVAHLTSADVATGFDHVVYGGIFFALVLAAVIALGWRFFDRGPRDRWLDALPRPLAAPPDPRGLWIVAAAILSIAALPPLWSIAIARTASPLPPAVALPIPAGWSLVPVAGGYPWQPRFASADRQLIGRYQNRAGQRVELAIALYARQEEGRELVGYGQGAVAPGSGWAWVEDMPAPPQGRAVRISAPGPVTREVVSFYRIGGILAGSELRVKLETLRVRLLGGEQRAAAIVISAEEPGARPAIDAFLRALGPVDRVADRAMDL